MHRALVTSIGLISTYSKHRDINSLNVGTHQNEILRTPGDFFKFSQRSRKKSSKKLKVEKKSGVKKSWEKNQKSCKKSWREKEKWVKKSHQKVYKKNGG